MNRIFFGEREFLFSEMEPEIPVGFHPTFSSPRDNPNKFGFSSQLNENVGFQPTFSSPRDNPNKFGFSSRLNENVSFFEYNDIKEWGSFVQKDFKQNLVFIHTSDPDTDFLRFLQNFRVVPAAGGLVKTLFPEGEKYLYIFRNGMWDLPKGKKEAGENDETNALREVAEETGMKGLKILHYLDHTYHFMAARDGGTPMVKQTAWFLMHIPAPQPPVPQTEEGIVKAEWLTLSEIKNILGLMYTSVATLSNRFLLDSDRP